ncbi:hypothetical protein J2X65_001653 [Ancylobacter sp. 3268]|uniref:DUF6441 family protein n=1 Tax=Ancylobacter sp. 3268 TaxID=2817752 RepID=UPI002867400E|nr:DUF6441 family protein [Ancylobacter sp. 3268]MDR6952298.1 hypothetical protein [Ancylobacter sp. 3268]
MSLLGATLDGDINIFMREELAATEQAVTRGVRTATRGLQTDLRQQVTGAGLGQRLANTWRSEIYPSGQSSLRAAGFVFSRAPEIVYSFSSGVTIRSPNGFFLAIPTAAAGVKGVKRDGVGRERITPGGWERRTGLRLRFVYRRGRPSLLVADNVRVDARGQAARNQRTRKGAIATRLEGRTTTVIFILVPQVSLRQRLEIDAATEKWRARLPSLIVDSWPGGNR